MAVFMIFVYNIFDIFWGRTGFDVLVVVLSACRALIECSLNKQSAQKSATDRNVSNNGFLARVSDAFAPASQATPVAYFA